MATQLHYYSWILKGCCGKDDDRASSLRLKSFSPSNLSCIEGDHTFPPPNSSGSSALQRIRAEAEEVQYSNNGGKSACKDDVLVNGKQMSSAG